MDKKRQRGPLFDAQYGEMALAGGLGACRQRGQASDPGAPAYSSEELGSVPKGSVEMGLGCGNPVSFADLRPGQVVLDLGSGGGLDAFVAARRVGAHGRVIGVDATPEMIEKARRFAEEGGFRNVQFRLGRIEHLPLADESVDVVISNCVINHASDKLAAFQEAMRVLRPAGRICISDLVVEGRVAATSDPGMKVWEAWLAVACGERAYVAAIEKAGFRDVSVTAAGYAGPAMIPLLAGKIIALQVTARK